MDLGIGGRWGIVCASTQGLGRACAEALVAESVNVVVNGREREKVEKAAAEIAAVGTGEVIPVAADLTDPAGRAALLAACPEPDILVLNNRGPKPCPLL
jgi:3-oxoacyl-[acyl-carrier protein] reductase